MVPENEERAVGSEEERLSSQKENKELQKGFFQKVSYWHQAGPERDNSRQELLLEKILKSLNSIDARLAKIEQARKD